jgi:DNA-binding CsgD family transcriptional regulator
MSKSERDILRVLSELYATGLGERDWLDTLGSISALFGAAGANAFDFDRASNAPVTCYIGDGNDVGRSDYIDHIYSIDPRLHNAIAHRGPLITCDYDVLSEEAMRRHEYYDWLGCVCGMKYHLGSKFIDDGDVFAAVSIELGISYGPPRQKDFELIALLTPHIANAWRMSQRLVRASRIDDFNLLLLESVPWGVVTLDHRGRVLSVNGPARRIMKRSDGLRISRGELRARRAADDRTLQIEVGRSLEAARGEGFHAGGAMAIGRAGEILPYGVRVLPLRHVTGPMPQGVAFVAVVIADFAEPQRPGHADLMAVLGLSRREADLAVQLSAGLPLREAAVAAGMSYNTARNHIRHMFDKTGARNQPQLVGILRRLSALQPSQYNRIVQLD